MLKETHPPFPRLKSRGNGRSRTNIRVSLDKQGGRMFSKVSFPIRYGKFSEIQTPDHIFHFNLNAEIKWVRGNGPDWPHPSEWLKRTFGGDWIYYSAGGYSGLEDFTGEHYLPCLPYPTNALIGPDPFRDPAVVRAMESPRRLSENLASRVSQNGAGETGAFFKKVIEHIQTDPGEKARRLCEITGAPISVLPPDARHVDYEVIPLVIADGCLYNCGFCSVKSGRRLSVRSEKDIAGQIRALKEFYGRDIQNANAIFLGLHDSLAAGADAIDFAAKTAHEVFDFSHSHMTGAFLFLFGSVDSLLDAGDDLFERLDRLPFYTHINIGLESPDPATLKFLKKPLTPASVEKAFEKMIQINRTRKNVEISANLVLGPDLPGSHLPACAELIEKRLERFYAKGALYMSPLWSKGPGPCPAKQNILDGFFKIKRMKKMETLLYLIQRL
ncbi:conserved hypothetical protein [Candidatus Desulfarcum epimagneticum]|uniref:Radical SAM core domain-containing protein n=1 Tax=uncultured Desulfobacteraceae bacterium TaxID=218296 RepID=A0A484HMS8_9BACT|nr:conserved hypothetical protein [uncultured Desulfobacteraceae bacterium]